MTDKFISNHTLCLGCNAGIIVNEILEAIDKPMILVLATGCLEVSTTTYPNSSYNLPVIHANFGNSAVVASGIANAKKMAAIPKETQIVVLAGDGATYDIGFGALSAMVERGEDVLYICYNNQAYMNTGIQKSGATPKGALTKNYLDLSNQDKIFPKSIIDILVAQKIPYAAQTIPLFQNDLKQKVKTAINLNGPRYIEVLSPCIRGWYYEAKNSMNIINLAVETNFWSLLEYKNQKLKINYKPKKQTPIYDWLKLQKRFSALLENKDLIDSIQKEIDINWKNLIKKERSN